MTMTCPMTPEWLRQTIRNELRETFSGLEEEIEAFIDGCAIERVVSPSTFSDTLKVRFITGIFAIFSLRGGQISYEVSPDEPELMFIMKAAKEEFANYALI